MHVLFFRALFPVSFSFSPSFRAAGGEDANGVVVSVHHEDGIGQCVSSLAAGDGRLRSGGGRTGVGVIVAAFAGTVVR